jgi:hypothetical protein
MTDTEPSKFWGGCCLIGVRFRGGVREQSKWNLIYKKVQDSRLFNLSALCSNWLINILCVQLFEVASSVLRV